MNTTELMEHAARIRQETARVLVGQDDLIETTLVAMLARGHVLIEGAPGLGKTLLVRALARAIGCSYRRIQFTPDLMPSDITGGNVLDPRSGTFVFHEGPIFTQFLLADEINRAPAKTQAALLEAMQERSVTVDGVTRALPDPFFVIATQNPIESHGTYPLPEAQLDRFLCKLLVTYPSVEFEKQILRSHLSGDPAALEEGSLVEVVKSAELVAMQRALGEIQVEEAILDYVTAIVTSTRRHRALQTGVSPRAAVALARAARAQAAVSGRGYVIPDDVKGMAPAVLRHRVILQPDAELEGTTAEDCIGEILRDVTVPKSSAA